MSPSSSPSPASTRPSFSHPLHAERPRLDSDRGRRRLPSRHARPGDQRLDLAAAVRAGGHPPYPRRRGHAGCRRHLQPLGHPSTRHVRGGRSSRTGHHVPGPGGDLRRRHHCCKRRSAIESGRTRSRAAQYLTPARGRRRGWRSSRPLRPPAPTTCWPATQHRRTRCWAATPWRSAPRAWPSSRPD